MVKLENLWSVEDIDRRSLADVFKANFLKDDWNFRDVRHIESFTADDYYLFFKSERSNELYYHVRRCLNFEQLSDEKGIYRSVSDKGKLALRKLASESRINRIRLKSLYGSDFDEERATH
jgi:hypothetical protein